MFKTTVRSLSIAFGIVATLTIAISGAAFATGPGTSATTTATLTVTGATTGLTVQTPNTLTFPATTLTGVAQTVNSPAGAFNIQVVDATGTNAGWSVTLAATPFTGTASSSNVLPTTTLTVTGITPTAIDGTVPTNTAVTHNGLYNTYPIQVTTGGTAAELYNADPGSGMGSTQLATGLALRLPATTIADTYTSTLTVAIGNHLTV